MSTLVSSSKSFAKSSSKSFAKSFAKSDSKSLSDNIQLKPKDIVKELDKHIIGQPQAKRAVAIALRNRWRKLCLDQPMADEILPKHILMIGSTGCGKSEIVYRLAKIQKAPYVKVEATKFTEVGYVGRDVEQIIRDLAHNSFMIVRDEEIEKQSSIAKLAAKKKLVEILAGPQASNETKKNFFDRLNLGELDKLEVEIEVAKSNSGMSLDINPSLGTQVSMIDIGDMFSKAIGGKNKVKKKVSVAKALETLTKQEEESLIDNEKISRLAITRLETTGIVFVDEIDKILTSEDNKHASVSREGVQRDLLPFLEGTTVNTKYGLVKTKHILFITAGAFHIASPSDLLPELQGRLPVRVELDDLSRDDFLRILTEPENSLIKQYIALLKIDNVNLIFEKKSLEMIASISYDINQNIENVGARRLFTVLEKLLEEISFDAPDYSKDDYTITAKYVEDKILPLAKKNRETLGIL